jgi:hypothetical protein
MDYISPVLGEDVAALYFQVPIAELSAVPGLVGAGLTMIAAAKNPISLNAKDIWKRYEVKYLGQQVAVDSSSPSA